MHKLAFIFKLAIRNIRLNRKKNLAALFSIMAGFMSVNLFEGYMEGAQEIFKVNYEQRFAYGNLIIHHQKAYQGSIFFDGTSYVSEEMQNKLLPWLKTNPSVEIVLRKVSFRGMVSNGEVSTPFIGEGIEVEEAKAMRSPIWTWNTSAGRPLAEASETVLGIELGRLLNCRRNPQDKFLNPKGGYLPVQRKMECPRPQIQLSSVTDSGQANAVFVDVVGLSNVMYRDLDSRFIQTPLSVAQNLLNTTGVSLITLRLKPGVDQKEFLSEAQSFIKAQNLDIQIAHWKETAFGEIYHQSMSFLNVLRGFFLVVILLIVMFSILATQTRLVFERITETATLRSIGYKNILITQIFLCEAFVLALVGSILGMIASVLVSLAIDWIGIFYLIGILSEEVPFSIVVTPGNALYSALMLIILAVVSCYIPLRKALALSISEAFAKK